MKNFTQRHGGTKDTEEGKVRGIHGLTRKGKGWEVMKLGEVCDFYNGLWTGKKPPFQTVGVIRNTNFTKDCLLDDTDIVYLEVEQSQFKNRKLQFGDIILEKSGGGPKQPVGRVVVYDKKEGDFSFSNFTSVIRIKNSKQLDFVFLHKFLFHEYLSGATEKMQSHSTGIRNLKFDEYKEIPIPLPSLSEQKHIVAILNECFTAIDKVKANVEKNLINARELFESYLQGVFGSSNYATKREWEERKLGEIADIEYGYTDKADTSGDYRYIRITDIDCEGLLSSKEKVYIKSTIENKAFVLNQNDLLMARTGATFAKVLLYENVEPSIFASYLIRIKFKIKIDSRFYWHFSKSKMYWDQANRLSSGAAQPQFNGNALKQVFFCYPKSLEEQKAIACQLDSLRIETQKLEMVYNKKIADLEELKKSVLQKAFAGELK